MIELELEFKLVLYLELRKEFIEELLDLELLLLDL